MEISVDNKKVFIDTNVLVFANVKTSMFHDRAKAKLIELFENDYELYISNQVVREYLSVLSRPDNHGNRIPDILLDADAQRLRTEFTVVFENEKTLDNLQMLLRECPTGGKQVHDANIVATMLDNDLSILLTYNAVDFKRFDKYISIITI